MSGVGRGVHTCGGRHASLRRSPPGRRFPLRPPPASPKAPLTAQHEGHVEEGVHGVGGGGGQRLGGRDVVDEPAHGVHLAVELIGLRRETNRIGG